MASVRGWLVASLIGAAAVVGGAAAVRNIKGFGQIFSVSF